MSVIITANREGLLQQIFFSVLINEMYNAALLILDKSLNTIMRLLNLLIKMLMTNHCHWWCSNEGSQAWAINPLTLLLIEMHVLL